MPRAVGPRRLRRDDGRRRHVRDDAAATATFSSIASARRLHERAASPSRSQGKPLTVDFSLVPGAVIRGQVVARDSGKPVAGALDRASSGGRGGRGGDGDGDRRRRRQLHAAQPRLRRDLADRAGPRLRVGRRRPSSRSASASRSTASRVARRSRVLDLRQGRAQGQDRAKASPGITLGAFSIAAQAVRRSRSSRATKDGAFEIVGVRPASYMLSPSARARCPTSARTSRSSTRTSRTSSSSSTAGVTLDRARRPAARVDRHVARRPPARSASRTCSRWRRSLLVRGDDRRERRVHAPATCRPARSS